MRCHSDWLPVFNAAEPGDVETDHHNMKPQHVFDTKLFNCSRDVRDAAGDVTIVIG